MDAILKVCDDYEEGKTFYSEVDANRWAEYSERVLTAPNTKKPARRQMTISWLRPLKGLSLGDYQLLCLRAALVCGARRQHVYFEGIWPSSPFSDDIARQCTSIEAEVCSAECVEVPQHQVEYYSVVIEEILGVPVDPGTGQQTNGEILYTVVLCGVYKEVVSSAWQSPQTDEGVGGTHPVCSESALRSNGSPRCGI